HCLEPEPGQRYQTARLLAEDLQRHLNNQPLRTAPEPSLRERLGKWRRRHPRLTSSTTVAACAAVIIAGLTSWFGWEAYRWARLGEARDSLSRFDDDMRTAQFLLNTDNADRARRDTGRAACAQALERYRVLD